MNKYKSEHMKQFDDNAFQTYKRFPLVVKKAKKGMFVGEDGKKYIDFMAGIAVNSLGYDDKGFKEALKKQIDDVLHVSNIFYTPSNALLAEKLIKESKGDFDRVFFANSGTEANEGALKLARLWASKNKAPQCVNFIAFENSFHGRSSGALALTGQTKYQEGFGPLLGEIRYAKFNDIDSVEKLVDETICAIIIEPIQGEGGVIEANDAFLKELRKLCVRRRIMLIFDEVQTGIGRTGELFAYRHYDIVPDVITLAKGLGNGIPVGAILAKDEFADVFSAGTHGTTFGGNPFATTAGLYVLEKISEGKFLKHVRETGDYFKQELEKIKEVSPFVTKVKGKGLMLGLELAPSIKPADIVTQCFEEGLLILPAGSDTLRFLPPLTIKKETIDKGMKILRNILGKLEA